MAKYSWVLNLVMGLALLVGGGWLLVYELQHPPAHSGHVYVMVGIALLGALLINPAPIVGAVKSVVIVILPALPWSKTQVRLSGASRQQPPEAVDGNKTAPPE